MKKTRTVEEKCEYCGFTLYYACIRCPACEETINHNPKRYSRTQNRRGIMKILEDDIEKEVDTVV